MELQLIKNENGGLFIASEQGENIGEITFVTAGQNALAFNHTEIYKEFSGRGLGEKMVLKALEYARNNQLQVLPLCSFVAHVFDKNPLESDVLKKI